MAIIIPNSGVAIIGQNGQIARDWYRLFSDITRLLNGQVGSAFALLSGATFTDNVSITKSSGNAAFSLDGVAGTQRRINFDTAGSIRWGIVVDSVAESGANAGSNLIINRYDDSASLLGTIFDINRSTGAATFYGPTNIVVGAGTAGMSIEKPGDVSPPHLVLRMPSSIDANDRFINFATTGTVGNVTTNGASNVAYNTSSDERLKTDLVPVDPEVALERLLSIPIYDGKWKADGSPFRGFLTKDLRDKIPGMVSGIPNGMEQDWIVVTAEGEIRETVVIRSPEQDGLDIIREKHPDALELHMLREQIAPECADYSRIGPEIVAALPAILGRIATLEARVAELESA